MKRNPCIEYIRLIACLIVVACHVNFQLASTADTEELKTFYFCVFSDGVAIFWMITGCFLFQNSKALPLVKRALTKVLLPALLLFALCLAISGWHLPVKYFDHTWYVFVYLAVIIVFPLLKRFADFLGRKDGRDLAFLCISLLLFLLNDLLENRLLFFGFTPLTGFLPAAAEILWGHILYQRTVVSSRASGGSSLSLPREDASENHSLATVLRILASVLLFFALNLARTFAQLRLYDAGSDYNLRVWYSVFGILCGACILRCGLIPSRHSPFKAQPITSEKNNLPSPSLSKALCTAASYTFGIYLLHPLLAGAATALDLWDILQKQLLAPLPYPIGSLLFLLIGTGGVFFASLLICVLLRAVKKRLLLVTAQLSHRGQP